MVRDQGHSADVVLFNLGGWSEERNMQLINDEYKDVKFTILSAKRTPFWLWLISSMAERSLRFLPLQMMNEAGAAIASSKRAFILLNFLYRAAGTYDWVVAHNPAAFYPALFFAKRTNAKLGIDVEDYHPGEANSVKNSALMKKLMRLVLPQAAYCSYAAPLIAAEVQKDIPDMQNKQLVILNGFNADEFIPPAEQTKVALRLVWFSQHIDAGRGLEKVIPVINKLYPSVELHLIGSLKAQFEQGYLQNKTGVIVHAPMPQKQLHHFLAQFDAGLATDIPVNRNRDIALTNKILAYAQAGLVIAAMHTSAQDQFLSNSNLLYVQMENTTASITDALEDLYSKKKNAELNKQRQFETGRLYAWQNLSKPLLTIWESRYA